MKIPSRCKDCIHCQYHDDNGQKEENGYCNYIEHFNGYAGTPVPYPYFYKEEHKCPGREVKEV